jgi:hypothetical protein
LIPRRPFFISDFPFVFTVREIILRRQQDLQNTTLFRHSMSFGPFNHPLCARRTKPTVALFAIKPEAGEESIGRWYRPTPSQPVQRQKNGGIQNSQAF